MQALEQKQAEDLARLHELHTEFTETLKTEYVTGFPCSSEGVCTSSDLFLTLHFPSNLMSQFIMLQARDGQY